MNNTAKRIFAVAAAAGALSLSACTTPITVSFDSPKPWQDGAPSYEKLVYDVSVYNTEKGSDEANRVKIASGSLTFDLADAVRTQGTAKYSTLDTAFTITYNANASEADKGCTDTVTSKIEFQSDSLATSTMKKTVSLAPREGEEKNLSYTVTADYFDTHKATRLMTGTPDAQEETMSIPSGAFYDNETMFYTARATGLGAGATKNFYLTNVFDSFVKGSLTTYTMAAQTAEATEKIDIGDFVKDYGVEPTVAEDGTTTYPVSCFKTDILMTDTKHGQPYTVYYTENPFVSNGKTHKKIPLKIKFDEYKGSALARRTEYVLVECSFDAPQE